VPGSRLLLKYHDIFTIPAARSRYVDLFRRHGIGEERLVLVDRRAEPGVQHLADYARIDIALDPFPFNGSTTTFEALWMGVPVITLQGDRMVARWTAAMLRKVDLSHLIAGSENDYVNIASRLAADVAQLARLRAGLRERVARSPLCAEKLRTRQLERLYRRMMAIRLAKAR
jgi:predicted O-linked N-acetylglucosamine transferase (SPINDLY family)